MEQKIRAAIFDVDGTLYDYQTHTVLPSTLDALEKLRRRGIQIGIASGRSYALLGDWLCRAVHPDFYVLANGHELLDANAQPLRLERFTPEQIERLMRRADEAGLFVMLKYHKYNCVYSGWDEMLAVFGEIGLSPEVFCFCPQKDRHRRELPLGVTLKGSPQLREQLAGLGDDLRVEYFFNPSECDVFRSDVNKLTGLRTVLGQIGIRPEECIAFGDSGNDVEMLRNVGYGVAMGNACDAAKAAAAHVCASSWQDGIARSLCALGVI